MKALKTVAVALGITLAALIVIPLVVLAGLFVWLKVTEEQEETARARSRRRLIRDPGAATPGGVAAEPGRSTPAATAAGVSVPGSERRLAEAGVLVVMVLWAANFIVVKSALEVLPPVGFTFLRFVLASITLFALLRWREGSVGLPRRDLLPICGLGALGFGLYQILWTTGAHDGPGG